MTTFNKNLKLAPKDKYLLLKFNGFPAPLPGVFSDEYEGGVALILPSFEVRPDDLSDEGFNTDPESWYADLADNLGDDLVMVNQYIGINPEEVCLVAPPMQWSLLGWMKMP